MAIAKDFYYQYKQKKVTAEEAVKVVKSGDWVQYGEFAMQPKTLDAALAKRVNELEDVKIRAVCTTFMPEVIKADPERKHFIYNDWHFSALSRRLHENNLCNYIPIAYHEAKKLIEEFLTIDVAFVLVAPMDERGFFNLGPSNSITSYVINKAKTVIVEVNTSVPICLGGNSESVHISQVDYIVESEDNPKLFNLPPAQITETDRQIASQVMNLIEDRCCLQLGIGGLPNAVGALIAQSDLKDLGVHTEMLVDSFVDMYEAGRITGKYKTLDKGKMVYTFALGTDKLYDFLHDNPVCASYPVHYTNDPLMIAQNDKVFAINNAIEVDLYGQVASEASAGRHISGTGGQLDFIYGAFRSKGGKGLICLSSTTTLKDGTVISRIKPTLDPGTIVTVPRSLAYYIVTEFGYAVLKGKSTWERAEALINIAHPDFRDELIKEAERLKIWVRTNRQDS
ncbi:butyryl-CoA:acetate CoA-transferase [Thermosyntropha lipolytica DSM 11003]|uniref:Probable butyrate:acetyl-CoA coenzyme A-transferase n=1 Tax=Thermosyntropha lipolytica DSM 11003 TaxID=1123382 RepID=A0A1M5PDE6_9FIRM|nr:acetyl-CoA hydrolase/transferase C-terminal domain-containing protein [Thermosyntropha lipolytica]SHG99824.1 butyryl-CoA:acetate CoA-transferase [Thermosyntropha lipolytica DSM 11003]